MQNKNKQSQGYKVNGLIFPSIETFCKLIAISGYQNKKKKNLIKRRIAMFAINNCVMKIYQEN